MNDLKKSPIDYLVLSHSIFDSAVVYTWELGTRFPQCWIQDFHGCPIRAARTWLNLGKPFWYHFLRPRNESTRVEFSGGLKTPLEPGVNWWRREVCAWKPDLPWTCQSIRRPSSPYIGKWNCCASDLTTRYKVVPPRYKVVFWKTKQARACKSCKS